MAHPGPQEQASPMGDGERPPAMEAKIPLFTVTKCGSILKNLFLNVIPPPAINRSALLVGAEGGDGLEKRLLVGRHPDCQIVLDHPSISRFHLEIRLQPSLQQLLVVDLSSVHGTWVCEQRIEPLVPIEMVEGDVMRLGASTRVYKLQWVSLSEAYEIEYPMQRSIKCNGEMQELNQVEDSTPLLDENNHFETGIQVSSQNPTPDSPKESSYSAIKMLPIVNLKNASGEEDAEKCTFLDESFSSSPALMLCSEAGLQMGAEEMLVSKGPLEVCQTNNELADIALSQIDISLIELEDPSLCKQTFTVDYSPQTSEILMSQPSISLEEVQKEVETPTKTAPAYQEGAEGEKPSPPIRIVQQREIADMESMSSILPVNFLSESNSELGNVGTSPDALVFWQVLTERDERITLASLERRDSSTSRRHNLASLIKVQSGSEEKSSGMVFIGSEKENDENRRATSSGKRVEESLCKVLFSGQVNEGESFVSDKENMTPTIFARSKSKLKENLKLELPPSKHLDFNDSPLSSSDYFPSDKENMTPSVSHSHKATRLGNKQNLMILDKENSRKFERIPFQSLTVNSKSESRASSIVNVAGKSTDFNSCTQSRIDKHGYDNRSVDRAYAKTGEYRKKWNMVVDASCLLDEESRKSLKLLEGIKGTHLIIPRMVIRELDCLKRKASWFQKDEDASSTLQWIEDCMVKTSWWIHVQSSSESVPIAPTPPASPRSWLSNGSRAAKPIPFSKCGDFMEIVSPTAGDHILECALLFKEIKNDEQIVLLTNDITLTIKAMAEGLICETAKDFRESLVNPFSKRFLWADSSPRGPTWSALDAAAAMRKNYCYHLPTVRTTPKAGTIAKGLKLILLHNSNYGQITPT